MVELDTLERDMITLVRAGRVEDARKVCVGKFVMWGNAIIARELLRIKIDATTASGDAP